MYAANRKKTGTTRPALPCQMQIMRLMDISFIVRLRSQSLFGPQTRGVSEFHHISTTTERPTFQHTLHPTTRYKHPVLQSLPSTASKHRGLQRPASKYAVFLLSWNTRKNFSKGRPTEPLPTLLKHEEKLQPGIIRTVFKTEQIANILSFSSVTNKHVNYN